tara:strand:+ start:866 stop:1891 length:1026 start_codon:yes stop_codon:yes gene_type:complete
LIPSDLGYTYLLNGMNVLFGYELGVLIHPAITVSYFYGVIIFLYYKLAGTGDLQTHVINNAELYSGIINTLTSLGIAFSCFFLANCIYKITHRISYSLFAIFSTLIIPIRFLPLIAYGNPESFLLILIPLIAGICFLKSNNNLPNKSFFIISSLLCALAIGVKFTSIPIVILPFLTCKGFQEKKIFILGLFLSIFIVFMPIYLNVANLKIFYWNMTGLLNSIIFERNISGSNNSFLQTIDLFYSSLKNTKVLFGFLIAQLSLFPFVRPKLYKDYPKLYKLSKFNFKLLITLVLSVAFIGIRPKVHYFSIFTPLQTLEIILSIYLLEQQKKLKSKNYIISNN